jgi:hypothetical protein
MTKTFPSWPPAVESATELKRLTCYAAAADITNGASPSPSPQAWVRSSVRAAHHACTVTYRALCGPSRPSWGAVNVDELDELPAACLYTGDRPHRRREQAA